MRSAAAYISDIVALYLARRIILIHFITLIGATFHYIPLSLEQMFLLIYSLKSFS